MKNARECASTSVKETKRVAKSHEHNICTSHTQQQPRFLSGRKLKPAEGESESVLSAEVHITWTTWTRSLKVFIAPGAVGATQPNMAETYQVVVRGLRGEKTTIELCSTEEQLRSMTVKQLRDKVAARLPDAAADTFMLIFTDQMLADDESLLSEYGIQQLSVILVVVSVEGWTDGGMVTKCSSLEKLYDF